MLLVGESWTKHTIHLQEFDQIHTPEYEEGASDVLDAFAASGFDVTYIHAHEI